MKRAMRTGLGLVLTTIALGVQPGFGQDEKQVKPPAGSASSFDFGGSTVFEHAIPNAKGKSLVAIRVTYPPGGKSPPHHHAPSAFIYGYVLSGAVRSQLKSTRLAKASTKCQARVIGSVKTQATRTLRAY
jgi:hypothetical protein